MQLILKDWKLKRQATYRFTGGKELDTQLHRNGNGFGPAKHSATVQWQYSF